MKRLIRLLMTRVVSARGRRSANAKTTGIPVAFLIAVPTLACSRTHFALKSSGNRPSKTTRWLLVVSFLSVVAAGVAQPATQPRSGFPLIATYSASEVGADVTTFSAIQAADGTMLFGGNELLSFDGARWTHTPIPGAYSLRGFDWGHDGRLWVAALGEIGWFSRGEDREWSYHSLIPMLPPEFRDVGEVWRVFAEEEGAVFVSANRIYRWAGGAFRVWPLPETRRLHTTRIGRTLYVYYSPEGLCELTADGPKVVIPRALLGDATVLWLEREGDAWLLAGSRGLFRYQDKALVAFAPEVSAQLQAGQLTCAVKLPGGRYAFGTMNAGIVWMSADGSLERVSREADGLPTRAIKSLHLDREGGLWVMSASHIARIDPGHNVALFDQRAGLPTHAYHTIDRHQATIAVGSEKGVHVLSGDGTFVQVPGITEHVHAVRSIADELVVARRHEAVALGTNRQRSLYRTTFDVLALATSPQVPGRIFLADIRSIVAVDSDGTRREVMGGLPDYARSIAEDAAGNVWVGTIARGVFTARMDPQRTAAATPVSGIHGLPALAGRAHVRSRRDGTVLIFADNGGWIKRPGEERFRRIERYPDRGIAAVSEIAGDQIWLVHSESARIAAGVARVVIGPANARWEPRPAYGLSEIGMPRSVHANVAANGPAQVWVGGTKSVVRLTVPTDARVVVPPPPQVFAFTREPSGQRRLVRAPLPYSTKLVQFELALPTYSDRAAMRLESKISGIDADWVPAGANAQRDLTALHEGQYSLQARTVANTGLASAPTTLTFEVLPPWWRKPSVIAAAVIALLPLGYGAYRLRVGALRRRNRDLELKVRKRTEELVQANAAKTQFVANMSHDIRNPLNGIVGLSLALEDTTLDARQREIVATLRECTTYLSSLVDDVLDFASIEAGRVELRPRAFAPEELLRSIVTTLKAEAVHSGATLTLVLDDRLPPNVLGDAGRIQQILVNFISNALKYAGGEVRIAARIPADSPGEIEFAVRDEGPGISAEDQATLFTKFTRLRQHGGGEPIPGTGLGLAACRLLADLMGGSVGVESQSGQGARFYLRLPLAIATEPARPAVEGLPNATVLLVEDTDYNAWAASAVLNKLGLSCERAHNGAEALRLFAEQRFNVVLLDRNLPDMDGTEVARRMREMESAGMQAVILAVTAYCTAEDRQLCLQAGMDAFVGKPLTPEKLRKVLLEAGRRLITALPVTTAPELATIEFDWSLLTFLSDGTPEGLRCQVERFVTLLDGMQTDVMAAWQQRDYDRLRTEAHRLLGHARMIGATGLIAVATALESNAADAKEPACAETLRGLRDEILLVTEAIRLRPPAVPSA